MPNQEICMVSIDSISALHHSDKARLETEQAAPGLASHWPPSSHLVLLISAPTLSSFSGKTPPLLVRTDPNHETRPHYAQRGSPTSRVCDASNKLGDIWMGLEKRLQHARSERNEWFGQHPTTPYPPLPLPNTSHGQNQNQNQNQTSRATAPPTITHHITLPADPLPPSQPDSTRVGGLIDLDREGLVRMPIADHLEHNMEGRPVTKDSLAKGILQLLVHSDSIRVKLLRTRLMHGVELNA